MSVLVNKNSKVIVQGFTGTEGTFHATAMIEYGTNVVGGVTPGKGGQFRLDKPVFNTVSDAVKIAQANTSIIFVPPAFAADAIMEAADAGIKVIICITEGIPVADMIKVAMIDIMRELNNKKLKTKMILQVHDELVFDMFKEEEVVVKKIVEDKMKNAIKLDIPLIVDMNKGKTWLEAH